MPATITTTATQAGWDAQLPGTLETLTPAELVELAADLESVPLGG